MINRSYEALLETLYDAVATPENWTTVCDHLAEAAGGVGAILIPDETEGRGFGLPRSRSLDESCEIYQRDGWYLRDDRYRGIASRARHGVMLDQDFTTCEDMAKLPYYQEFLRPCGLMWFAGIGFSVEGKGWTASIQRSSKQGPFSESERQQLVPLISHLSRAASTAAALRYARLEGALQAFEQMSIGAVAVDERGRCCLINQEALALMGDGLRVVEGQLSAADSRIAAALGAAIGRSAGRLRQTSADPPAVLYVPRPSGNLPYQISICPLGPQSSVPFGQARALVLIVDPEKRRMPPRKALRARFGLTNQELKVAEQIARGHSIAAAAETLAISKETARYYLKAVFSKTDTHKQSELIVLLAKLALLPKDIGSGDL